MFFVDHFDSSDRQPAGAYVQDNSAVVLTEVNVSQGQSAPADMRAAIRYGQTIL
jgi:hypothetical protein